MSPPNLQPHFIHEARLEYHRSYWALSCHFIRHVSEIRNIYIYNVYSVHEYIDTHMYIYTIYFISLYIYTIYISFNYYILYTAYLYKTIINSILCLKIKITTHTLNFSSN